MDRSWCVATEVDLYDTFIGGTEDCASAVLAAADLEAFRVAAQDRIDSRGTHRAG